jgi:hypothetical protein
MGLRSLLTSDIISLMNRRLMVVPVIHSQEDYGSKVVLPPYERNRAMRFWDLTTSYFLNAELNFNKLRVYQDSLAFLKEAPESKINKITNDMITEDLPDSPNYNLLRSLREKGAKITATEEIYLAEQAKEAYLSENGFLIMALVEIRDKAIAKRISSTLGKDELGLLFIGYQHAVAKFLPEDMEIETPKVIEDFYKNNFKGENTQDFGRGRRL